MTVLVAWLWQGAVIAAVVTFGLRLTGRWLNATTRHRVWWAALLGVMLVPLAHVVSFPGERDVATTAETVAAVPLLLPEIPGWVPWAALALWCVLAARQIGRVARSIAHVRRLKTSAAPMPPGRRLPLSRAALGAGRHATLAVSRSVGMPCALGLGPACVLVPSAWLALFPDEELDLLVLHEYGHLARRDDRDRLAIALVHAVVGWHPAVRWIGRQLELERESACDDFVVQNAGNARSYAACLARAAAVLSAATGERSAPALGMAIVGRASVLRRRVIRLLRGRQTGRTRLARSPVVIAAGLLPWVVTVLVQSGPLVVFGSTIDALEVIADGPPLATSRVADANAAARGVDAVVPVPGTMPRKRPARRERARTEPSSRLSSAAADQRTIPPIAADADPAVGIVHRGASPRAESSADLFVRRLPDAWSTAASLRSASSIIPADARAGRDRSERSGPDLVAVGTGAKRAGLAVAGFFTRAGKSIGASF